MADFIKKFNVQNTEYVVHKSAQVTLASNSWGNDNVYVATVNGMTSNATVIVGPAGTRTAVDAWAASEIFCSDASLNQLYFACTEKPTVDVVVNVFWTEV